MSEAPKKIWVSDMGGWFEQEGCGSDIPYIRADIVDELVEELKNIANANPAKWDEDTRDQFQQWAQNRARVALAKLEESHE